MSRTLHIVSSLAVNNMAERGQLTLFALAAVFGILLIRDFVPVDGSSKDVPKMKFNNLMGPTLRFLYCYS